MFDIGAMEIFIVAALALVVVGPKELPKLLRSIGGIVKKARELTHEFRRSLDDLANEAERELDPFSDLRKKEGLKPGMSPEEVTDHIMANRKQEKQQPAKADKPSEPKSDETVV
ncbi:Sec-independent protein translocase protein TatB [Kordiimonas pumila]|uniref:Sec-independent protein translocase protein TatB n=1 Tax=Kordiimonas pumila TaxID=2161677 RepID=A0ABV7D2E7_9PROT|nr:Sec-independent protein translocase protein TatB [Kordiimonas pumila]